MPTLRLLAVGTAPADLDGEVLSCAYTPDGAFLLAGGWDGCLRLWETAFGAHVTAFPASEKPVSACAVSPDGKTLASGTLDGMLGQWDSVSHQQRSKILAHTRPLSTILYGRDNQIVTASWDGTIVAWKAIKERDGRTFSGHKDIIAGCRYTPDGQGLVSWAHDGTVRVWDLMAGKERHVLTGHEDKVLAGGVSPDGRWAASGSRDGTLKLWDLRAGKEAAKASTPAEVRGCLFLLDGETLLVVDAAGQLTLHAVPSMERQAELAADLPVSCVALSPSGSQVALGCTDGSLRFIAIDGLEGLPLCVAVTQTLQRTATRLQRLFGRSKLTYIYGCTCPACRHSFELPSGTIGQLAPCPHCRRQLKAGSLVKNV